MTPFTPRLPRRVLTVALVALGLAIAPSRAAPAPPPNLISNGDLETDANADLWPDGWEKKAGASWQSETVEGKTNHYLRLQQTKAGEFTGFYQPVPVPAEVTDLDLRFRFRTENVVLGQENYHDARFIFHFRDAAKKELKTAPDAVRLPADSAGWQERQVHFTVPRGAVTLEVMPTLFQVQSGALAIDDLILTAAQAPAPQPESSALVVPEPATPTPPSPLKVVGNKLINARGETVILRGVNVPSLDWMPEGDHVTESVKVAVALWKCSAIRLPVNDKFWFGRGPRQSDGGQAYRALVESCVRAAAKRGAYVILDLHDYRATKPDHLKFWAEVAALYKNDPAVLLDVLNEPHDISWQVWRDGGRVEEKPAQNGQAAVTFESPGMQKVVDFIRAQGARNVIVASGLDWGYDLSGVANGYALADKSGDGIVYSAHTYSWKTDWRDKILAAAQKFPVVLGEVGADERRLPSVPPDQQEDPYIWMPEVLGFAQQNDLSWIAWSFHTDATPRLLANWDYQPTPFFGSFVRSALLGARFQNTKLR